MKIKTGVRHHICHLYILLIGYIYMLQALYAHISHTYYPCMYYRKHCINEPMYYVCIYLLYTVKSPYNGLQGTYNRELYPP
jgi:hypothetical protein